MAPADPEKPCDVTGQETLWCVMRVRADRHMGTNKHTDTLLSFYTNTLGEKYFPVHGCKNKAENHTPASFFVSFIFYSFCLYSAFLSRFFTSKFFIRSGFLSPFITFLFLYVSLGL
jgi:hypothetical protein